MNFENHWHLPGTEVLIKDAIQLLMENVGASGFGA